jgi:ABC-type sugar transport system permease subunit
VLRWGYIFALPGLLAYLLFTAYPLITTFWQSLHLIRGASNPWVFVRLQNYAAIFKDDIFWSSLVVTLKYVLMTVPTGIVLAFIVSIALESLGKFQGFFRSLFFIPSVAGVVVIGIIFGWIYEPYNGMANMFLKGIGLPSLNWIRSKELALPSIALMTVWRTLGYNVVILLAALTTVPRHYYEAASIDGVGFLRKHWLITIPLIAPTLMFVLIYNTIQNMQVFTETFIMTGGGPGQATTTIGYRIFQNAFIFSDFGMAGANAVVLLLIVLIITILQMRLTKRSEKAYSTGGRK